MTMSLLGDFPLLVAACAALSLAAGCGGGGEGQSSSSTTTREGPTATAEPPIATGEAPTHGPQGEKGGGAQPKRPALQDTSVGSPEPGTKAVAPGVPVQPAGDNSIQTFGTEGEVEGREQALTTLRTYLSARAAGRWAEACAATSRQFKRQLATVAATLPKNMQPKGCAAALRFFFHWFPQAALRASAEVRDLLSFRVRGRYAYIIFRGAEEKVGYIAMRNDDGVWRINTANPEPFPSAAG
jgi:hypothetical protein